MAVKTPTLRAPSKIVAVKRSYIKGNVGSTIFVCFFERENKLEHMYMLKEKFRWYRIKLCQVQKRAGIIIRDNFVKGGKASNKKILKLHICES